MNIMNEVAVLRLLLDAMWTRDERSQEAIFNLELCNLLMMLSSAQRGYTNYLTFNLY